jgi:hypothetical protein
VKKMIYQFLRLISIGTLSLGFAQASNTTDLLHSFSPEIQFQSMIDKVCIQGFYAQVYRLHGRLNFERAISKVAGIIPLESVGEVQPNFFLAHWSNDPQSHLIGLWPVSETEVDGIYSTLSAVDQTGRAPNPLGCKHLDSVARDMIAWIHPAMGLRPVLSSVDHARVDPSHTLIYSSWLPSPRLVTAISIALDKAGWNFEMDRTSKGLFTAPRSIVAIKASAQLNLKIFSVSGSSILFMVGQQGKAYEHQ